MTSALSGIGGGFTREFAWIIYCISGPNLENIGRKTKHFADFIDGSPSDHACATCAWPMPSTRSGHNFYKKRDGVLPLERRCGGGEAKDKYGIHDPSRRQEGRDVKQMGCSMEYTG